ncbi:hypothetical protein JCM21900_001528 [Sporobolomyces salmonicolor]
MSEYWVSRDKYWCRYCKIYIADDKPSRTQHETGLRHKGNYERYIRDIYKKGDRDRKDKAEEAKEIARIEAAAQLAMQAAGDPVASTSTSASAPPKARPAAASSDPYANYTTAASLGIVDEEADRQAAEAELRQKEGRIGEWERVVRPKPPAAPAPSVASAAFPPSAAAGDADADSKPGTRDDPKPVKKGYFTEKSLAFDDDEFDPASVGVKLKRKRVTLKEEEEEEERARQAKEREEREEREREARDKQASRRGRGSWQEAEVQSEPMLEFDTVVKSEEDGDAAGATTALPGAKEPEEKPAVSTSGGFKKRKMLGANAARKK